MENQHKGWRLLATVFKVLAWGSLVVGVIGALGVLLGPGTPEMPRPAAFLIVTIASLLQFCLFMGIGGILQFLLVIEAQTRKAP